ncbi:hypothetical protein BP5796_12976 [Coleophoma crateriformis]|uniref:Uncharacterized protein n=1 Tax=Coleophoma crateriformis TaxID=565419 RepID=A0A3D8Q510_9HELO|nr:hypothetical protein BP5796_12976 [Coleophoma crateriformis]
MPFIMSAFVALALLTIVLAHNNHGQVGHHLFRRDETKYTTVTAKSLVTTTAMVPTTINTEIGSTGVKTLIPGYLTMTFKEVPAYVYIETETMGSTVITSSFVTRMPVASHDSSAKPSTTAATSSSKSTSRSSSSSSKPSSSIKSSSSTSSKPLTSSTYSPSKPTSLQTASTSSKATMQKVSSTVTTSSASASPTCCFQNNNQVVLDPYCDGHPDGYVCGSGHTCWHGGCYWFNHDDMCGSLTNSCNTDAGFYCVNAKCQSVLNDPNNCGRAYSVCGGDPSVIYGCSNGVCVSLSGDSNNCGTVGHACPTGTGCQAGKCIDTTSDDNNCSVVGYACPAGTLCKNSLCVSNGFCGTSGKPCPTGTGCRDGVCIDTTSDDSNCSQVGYACPSGTICKDSWCQPKPSSS